MKNPKKNSRKGNTYRKCYHCNHYHPNEKLCRNLDKYQGKKAGKLPNSIKCHHLSKNRDDYFPVVFNELVKKYDKHQKKNKPLGNFNFQENKISFPKKKFKHNNTINCPVCLTEKANFIKLGCKHSLCRKCYDITISTESLKDKCPLCRQNIFQTNHTDYLLTNKKYGNYNEYILLDIEKINPENLTFIHESI